MSKLVVQPTEDGFHISADTLKQMGLGLRRPLEVQLSELPGEEQIQRRAAMYAAKHLGSGVLVGLPQWRDGEWAADLRSPDQSKHLGYVYLDPHGDVKKEKSATFESVRQALYAASPANPPT